MDGSTDAGPSSAGQSPPSPRKQAPPDAPVRGGTEEREEHERKGKGKEAPRRRRGKVIGKLRDQLSLDSPSPPSSGSSSSIRPSSPGSTLAVVAMRNSLGYHLIQMASGEIMAGMALAEPRRLDLTAAYASARDRAARAAADPYNEVVLACFHALGARRSSHSNIVGGVPGRRNLELDRGDAMRTGERREAACQALARRAIALAESSGLLVDPSSRGLEITNLLRLVLFTVTPRNPFSLELVAHDRRVRKGHDMCVFAQRLISFDAYLALNLNLPLQISDLELAQLGCGPSEIRRASDTLLGPPPIAPFTEETKSNVRLGCALLMRALAQLDALGPIKDPSLAQLKFEAFWCQANVYAEIIFDDTAQSGDLSIRSLVLESTLAKLADRQFSSQKRSSALLDKSQIRYLKSLKRFILLLVRFSDSPEENHMRALLIDSLDLYPVWLQVTLAAAVQYPLQADGRLAEAGFSWGDLMTLQRLLAASVPAFPSSGRREVELEMALAALGLTSTPVRSPPPFDPPIKERSAARAEGLAGGMVRKVLEQLSIKEESHD